MDSIVRVASYDGQTVWLENRVPLYEVGNFLGGGAAGTVYEAENVKTKEHFALKILNPLGYKMLSPSLLRRCAVMSKGKPMTEAAERAKEPITKEHVWWLLNGSTKQFLVAYYSERQRSLHELSLVQCMNIWGVELPPEETPCSSDSPQTSPTRSVGSPNRNSIPAMPPKYEDFVRRRSRIFREICNMRKISPHENVIRLESVLELAQDSKCTIFLVMELANGGELFDRIKIDCGTVEETAGRFFSQLLHGVRHCHDEGVCHRDLKPENLLLQDSVERGPILKIADFGFSARLAMADEGQFAHSTAPSSTAAASSIPLYSSSSNATSPTISSSTSPMRVLMSVVGSPFYVAPEVLQAQGYDGRKADSWSLGVILYAMLAGNMPFSQDLVSCKRFRQFCIWAREQSAVSPKFWQDPGLVCPSWLFSVKFSTLVRGLIVAMLLPDPADRISVKEAQNHSWCRAHEYQSRSRVSGSGSNNVEGGRSEEDLSAVEDAHVQGREQREVPQQESGRQDQSRASPRVSPQSSPTSTRPLDQQDSSHPHPHTVVVTSPLKSSEVSSPAPSPRSQLAQHLSSAGAGSTTVTSPPPIPTPPAGKEPIQNELHPVSPVVGKQAGSTIDKSRQDSPRTAASTPAHIQTVLHNIECHGMASLDLMDVESDYGDNVDAFSEQENELEEQFQMDGDGDDDDGEYDSESALKRSKKSPGTQQRYDESSYHSVKYPPSLQEKSGSGSVFQGFSDAPPPSIGGVGRARRSSSTGSDTLFDPFHPGHSSHGSSIESHEDGPQFRIPRSPYDGHRRSPYESGTGGITIGSSSGGGVYGSNNSNASSFASSPRRGNGGLITPPPIPSDAIPYIIAGTPDLLGYEESHLYPLRDGSGGAGPSQSQEIDGNKEDVVAPPQQSAHVMHSDSSTHSSMYSSLGNKHPPSFHDAVKRSTRFITSVPAEEVLETVDSILEQCRLHRTASPIGVIGRVELYWESYRLDVWGADASDTSPPLCSLHLYQLPNTAHSTPGSPIRLQAAGGISTTPGSLGGLPGGANAPLFLVEFVRGQLEIFAFKRFYEWIRQRVSELVKRDYAFNLFDQSGSPILTSHIASSPLRGNFDHLLYRS
mmetsp:Transcript_15470/g.25758  ORF Transcript_15470/g.25758 Transcript_15470/m.25758 type:complete len:1106 (+) Transcript_15470:211-3528(+)